MGLSNNCSAEVLSNNSKIVAHEGALQQSLISFKELVSELVQIQNDAENYRVKYLLVKEKCENKTCSGVKQLRKAVEAKDLIIQSVASILTRLNETRNFNILSEAFKILCEEAEPLTPPVDKSPIDVNQGSIDYDEIVSEVTDVSFREESLCEIEGTPTGRTSPILNMKAKVSSRLSDLKDKKKCPDDWPTPETKCVKLIYSTPTRKGGKLTQSRLQLVKSKPSKKVDLTTCVMGNEAQAQIKKEPIDNEDTILPSPTSGPTHITLLKNTSKSSPSKFKKPHSFKVKSEKSPQQDENVDVNKQTDDEMDMSINILNQLPLRLRNNIKSESAIKPERMEDDDVTHCEILSMMTQIDKSEARHINAHCSPSKRPLSTNMNIMNTPPRPDPSPSTLRPDLATSVDALKRKTPELVGPVYKEPTVRNKAEKRLLQGWSCEDCQKFYGTLYKNDPVMLARKINECSKHRGRHNPARPKTPPNFWNPRWDVPEDTDELNRLNNAT